jgi:hypothetical protein
MARLEIAAFRPQLYQTLHPRPEENAPLSRKIKRIAVVQGELLIDLSSRIPALVVLVRICSIVLPIQVIVFLHSLYRR